MNPNQFTIADDRIQHQFCGWNVTYRRWRPDGLFGALYRSPQMPYSKRTCPSWRLFDEAGDLALPAKGKRVTADMLYHQVPGMDAYLDGKEARPDQGQAVEAFKVLADDIPNDVRDCVARLGSFQWRALEALAWEPKFHELLDPRAPLASLAWYLYCWRFMDRLDNELLTARHVDTCLVEGTADLNAPSGRSIKPLLGSLDLEGKGIFDLIKIFDAVDAFSGKAVEIGIDMSNINRSVADYLSACDDDLLFPDVAEALGQTPNYIASGYLEIIVCLLQKTTGRQRQSAQQELGAVKSVDDLRRTMERVDEWPEAA